METVEKGKMTKDGYLDEIRKDGKHESGEYGDEDSDKENEIEANDEGEEEDNGVTGVSVESSDASWELSPQAECFVPAEVAVARQREAL